MVTRYRPEGVEDGGFEMAERDDGEYVTHDDYEKLEKAARRIKEIALQGLDTETEALRAELEKLL